VDKVLGLAGVRLVGMWKEDLKTHLLEFSVEHGDFTLKSGRKSSWFIDGKQTVCTPAGLRLVAEGALGLMPAAVDSLGGLTLGADPVAYGIAGVAAAQGRDFRSFSVRKQAKGHGARGRIAGALREGDRVVVTEDVVTRGTSPLEAVEVIRAFGAEPVMILAVVDRGGTVEARAAAVGVPFVALLTAPELGLPYEGAE